MKPFVYLCPKCGYRGNTGWTTVVTKKRKELWISCPNCGDKIAKWDEAPTITDYSLQL